MAAEIERNEDDQATTAIETYDETQWKSRTDNSGLNCNAEWLKWNKKLLEYAELEKGWDSYDAAPPTPIAIKAAGVFLEILCTDGMNISRLSPSVVGGVAFTFRTEPRMVYVEFRNTGNAHAAFTDDSREDKVEPEVIKVRQDSTGYFELIARVKSHLHEQTALSRED